MIRGVWVAGISRAAWRLACWYGLVGLIIASTAIAMSVRARAKVEILLEAHEPERSVESEAEKVALLDFSQHLAAGRPDSVILQALQGSAQAAHVAVGSVQVQEHRPPQENALGHARISVEWHGRYQDIKKALADVLDRLPGVSVERVALRRAASQDAVVDAVVSLSVWSAAAALPNGAAQ